MLHFALGWSRRVKGEEDSWQRTRDEWQFQWMRNSLAAQITDCATKCCSCHWCCHCHCCCLACKLAFWLCLLIRKAAANKLQRATSAPRATANNENYFSYLIALPLGKAVQQQAVCLPSSANCHTKLSEKTSSRKGNWNYLPHCLPHATHTAHSMPHANCRMPHATCHMTTTKTTELQLKHEAKKATSRSSRPKTWQASNGDTEMLIICINSTRHTDTHRHISTLTHIRHTHTGTNTHTHRHSRSIKMQIA